MSHYDDLETRSADERDAAQDEALRDLHGFGLDALAGLPVLRKSEMASRQAGAPPFGDLRVAKVGQVFQSPGPIYEPGGFGPDWWRMGRFLHACGIGPTDVVQNCFGYHLTPAGISSRAARAPSAHRAARGHRPDRPAGARGGRCAAPPPTRARRTTSRLILDRADEMGERRGTHPCGGGGGALFPWLRTEYADRGIACLRCYATADLGNIAYEVRRRRE